MRVDNFNRNQLIDKYIDTLVDGMDMDSLVRFTNECLHNELKTYGNAELNDLISRIYPELLED